MKIPPANGDGERAADGDQERVANLVLPNWNPLLTQHAVAVINNDGAAYRRKNILKTTDQCTRLPAQSCRSIATEAKNKVTTLPI